MSIAKTPSFLKEVLVEVGIIAQDNEVRLVVDVFKSCTCLQICFRRILEFINNDIKSNFDTGRSVSAKMHRYQHVTLNEDPCVLGTRATFSFILILGLWYPSSGLSQP